MHTLVVNDSYTMLKMMNGPNVFQMNATEENLVRTIAAEDVSVKGNAEAILSQVYNEFRIPEAPELELTTNNMVSKKGQQFNDNEETVTKDLFTVNSYPNPFDYNITIDIYLPEIYTNNRLLLFDINGKMISEYFLKQGTNTLSLNTYVLDKGVYFYKVESNGALLTTERIVKL